MEKKRLWGESGKKRLWGKSEDVQNKTNGCKGD
jgi:hypothetical protein